MKFDLTLVNWISNNILSEKCSKNNVSIKKISTGQYTNAYKCIIHRKNTPDLFIKKKKKDNRDNDTYNEYITLKKLWKMGYCSNQNYRIPKPYGYIKETEFLITEYIPGIKLSNYIAFQLSYFFVYFHKKKMLEIFTKIANWLSDYERKTYTNNHTKIECILENYYNIINEQMCFASAGERHSLINALKEKSSGYDLFPVHLVNTDFKIHNILLHDNNIIVIDWEKMKKNFYGFWMASAFIRSFQNLITKWYISPGRTKELRDCFFSKYFETTPLINYIDMYSIIESLESIIYLVESKQNIAKIPLNINQKNVYIKLKKNLGIN